jgi:hypothetical protein
MKCTSPAIFRYTWPGQEEKQVCLIHAIELKTVSVAMGFPLQFIPLKPEEMGEAQCSQEEKKEEPA